MHQFVLPTITLGSRRETDFVPGGANTAFDTPVFSECILLTAVSFCEYLKFIGARARALCQANFCSLLLCLPMSGPYRLICFFKIGYSVSNTHTEENTHTSSRGKNSVLANFFFRCTVIWGAPIVVKAAFILFSDPNIDKRVKETVVNSRWTFKYQK